MFCYTHTHKHTFPVIVISIGANYLTSVSEGSGVSTLAPAWPSHPAFTLLLRVYQHPLGGSSYQYIDSHESWEVPIGKPVVLLTAEESLKHHVEQRIPEVTHSHILHCLISVAITIHVCLFVCPLGLEVQKDHNNRNIVQELLKKYLLHSQHFKLLFHVKWPWWLDWTLTMSNDCQRKATRCTNIDTKHPLFNGASHPGLIPLCGGEEKDEPWGKALICHFV